MNEESGKSATHRHHKGGLYRVLMRGVTLATNGQEGYPQVVYQSCEDAKIYVRDEDEFDETIQPEMDMESTWYRRFQPLKVN